MFMQDYRRCSANPSNRLVGSSHFQVGKWVQIHFILMPLSLCSELPDHHCLVPTFAKVCFAHAYGKWSLAHMLIPVVEKQPHSGEPTGMCSSVFVSQNPFRSWYFWDVVIALQRDTTREPREPKCQAPMAFTGSPRQGNILCRWTVVCTKERGL